MNICLDNIIFSLQRNGGISVYWAQLLDYLLKSDHGVKVIERHDSIENIQRQCLDLPENALVEDSSLPLQLARYLPVLKTPDGCDIFHSSYYRTPLRRGVKRVVSVYDFTYELHAAGLRRFVHSRQKQQALQCADRIICISQSTADDLLRLYPFVSSDRVRVIHLGCSPVFRPAETSPPLGFDWLRDTGYILFVGDRGGYKNFDLAVKVVGACKGLQLVAVGGKPITASEQKHINAEIAGRFRYVGNVAEQTLNCLYNYACCLLYPSAYEGFGLPPLEAMQAGCPVIACKSSSIPEVCGDAALLADNACPEEFTAMVRLLQAGTIRQVIREKGFKQAKRFSWVDTCRKTVDVYGELLCGV